MQNTNIERLEKLGLKTASNRIKELKDIKQKMTIAYEHFRYVEQEKINNFNQKLRQETLKEDTRQRVYKQLQFIRLEDYPEVPPSNVLDRLEEAQKLGCFDYYEVAKIESVVEIKDPIVFGRINKCPDRFFVAQWDDDVKIEQILNQNEG